MTEPLISIIIPTFNRAALIGETLQSVLNQTYKKWECIIIDDGSKENTEKTIRFFLLDNRIKFYRRPANRKKGASSCRNYGLELSQGELIQFLDDDDLLAPQKLEEQVRRYSGGLELLTCKWGGFTDSLNLKTRFKYGYHSYCDFRKPIGLLNSFGLYNEFFPPLVYLTPKALIDKAGGWNEDLSNNDDAEFFTRIVLEAFRVLFVPGAVVYYRYNSPDSLSSLDSSKKISSLVRSWNLIKKDLDKNRCSLTYVNRAKNNLYLYFQENQPSLLIKYSEFFDNRKDYDRLETRILERVKLAFGF